MYNIKDMSYLEWDTNPTKTLGTGGTYLKAIDRNNGKTKYYKMSMYDSYLNKVVGYESVYEIIVYRLCKKLGIKSLQYRLIKAKIKVNRGKENEAKLIAYITESEEFKRRGERKYTFENFYMQNKRANENTLDFVRRIGFRKYVDKMMLIDFIVANRDRHGANIEVLKSDKGLRLAPIFDNGMSFMAPYGDNIDAIRTFNVRMDVKANNFIGSRSLQSNLGLISEPVIVHALRDCDKSAIMYNLKECMPQEVQDKVWCMIMERYNYAKNKKVLIEMSSV